MNERDEPMKGLAEFLRRLADSAVVKLLTAYAGESRLPGWAAEVEASRQRSAVVEVPPGLLDALRRQRRIDDYGAVGEVSVSREAVNKAIELLAALPSERPAAPAQSEGDA